MIVIPVENSKSYYKLLASDEQLFRFLVCRNCGSVVIIFWGTYPSKSLPRNEIITIQRIRCKDCQKTHSLLPAFLYGKIQHTHETINPYVLQFIKAKITISQLFEHYDMPNAPQCIETLRRWFKRFSQQCKILLPLLKQQIMLLMPQTDLDKMQQIMLSSDTQSTYHVCRTTWLMAKRLLTDSAEILQCDQSLPPLIFLSYFYWQKKSEPLFARLKPPD